MADHDDPIAGPRVPGSIVRFSHRQLMGAGLVIFAILAVVGLVAERVINLAL